ncbi:hypothetical protein C8J46_105430 [Sphingomonas sp. PP-F2F-A104-K0414]|nr:hypothetical protein C8J46_105430 [Sphingomonas sp. PP-F2F-A104-K0414]
MSFLAACFGGPLLRRLIGGWWDSFKAKRAGEPVPMKLRGGVWRPSGLVHNVDRAADWVAYFGMFCILLAIVGAVYGATK